MALLLMCQPELKWYSASYNRPPHTSGSHFSFYVDLMYFYLFLEKEP